MIRIYILYSYGMVGYQTYLVEGQANESMTQVPETSMPEGTSVFFVSRPFPRRIPIRLGVPFRATFSLWVDARMGRLCANWPCASVRTSMRLVRSSKA